VIISACAAVLIPQAAVQAIEEAYSCTLYAWILIAALHVCMSRRANTRANCLSSSTFSSETPYIAPFVMECSKTIGVDETPLKGKIAVDLPISDI
jgi:hypothetical protein